MANTNLPKGFKILDTVDSGWIVEKGVAASETISDTDVLFLNSAGFATLTPGEILGVQIGKIKDGLIPGQLNTVSSSVAGEDKVMVCIKPDIRMLAQISTGAVADPYTTRSSAACFDIVTTTGAQYINSAASSQDYFKIIGPAAEVTGESAESAAGAYQKVVCMFNPALHFLGTTA